MSDQKCFTGQVHTAFVAAYRDSLAEWVASLEGIDGPVLAISRKTPRLLELLLREGIGSQALLDRLVTEHSFVSQRAPTDMILTDDILVRGTTFLAVRELVKQALPTTRVHEVPFAVGETALKRVQDVVTRPFLTLEDHATLPFVTSEMAALGTLGKPCDLDHPILYVDLESGTSAEDIGEAIAKCSERIGLAHYPIDMRAGGAGDLPAMRRNWSVLAPISREPQESGVIRKVRCYFDPSQGRACLVPIAPRSGSVAEFLGDTKTLPFGEVQVKQRRRRQQPLDLDLLAEQSTVLRANYLLELLDLRPLLDVLVEEMRVRHLTTGRARLEAQDLRYLFDRDSVERTVVAIEAWLERPVQSALDSSTATLDSTKRTRLYSPAAVPPADQELDEAFVSSAMDLVSRMSSYNEAFSAVFEAHRATSTDPVFAPRLRFSSGITMGTLLALTQRMADPDLMLAHKALDSLIDSGVAIPRYVCDGEGPTRSWRRAFRPGEANAHIRADVVAQALDALAQSLGDRAVPEVLTEKYLVLLCEHLELFNHPALYFSEGIRRDWYLYGARPVVDVGGEAITLVKWALKRKLISRGVARDGTRRYLIPEYGPSVWEGGLPDRVRHMVAAVARWTVAAYRTEGLGSGLLKTLASCESDWAYEQALLAELQGWVGSEANVDDDSFGQPSMPDTWPSARAFLLRPSTAGVHDIRVRLEKVANWLAQAKAKGQLRDHLPRYLDTASSTWPDASCKDHDTTWRDYVRPALVRRGSRQDQNLPLVLASLAFCRHVTTVVRTVVTDVFLGLPGVSTEDLKFKPNNERTVREFREFLDSEQPLALSIDRPALAEAVFDFENSRGAALITDIDRLVGESTEIARRVLSILGPTREPVPVLARHYCIYWDVRNSTGQSLSQDLIRFVNRTIVEQFWGEIEGCDLDATSDSNLAITASFEIAERLIRHLVQLYGSDGFDVRVGLEMTSQSIALLHLPPNHPTGSVIEHAKRLRDLFTEIRTNRNTWTGPRPLEPSRSYIVAGASTTHFVSPFSDLLGPARQLDGTYKPRVRKSLPRTVYVAELS